MALIPAATLFPIGEILTRLIYLGHPVSSLFFVSLAVALGAVLLTLEMAVDAIERLRDRVDELESELNSRRSTAARDDI